MIELGLMKQVRVKYFTSPKEAASNVIARYISSLVLRHILKFYLATINLYNIINT
jgi:hypothetical protein